MILNDPDFEWTAKRERAAALVADDALTNDAIAERCGVKAATIERWKRSPVFRARVEAIIAEVRLAMIARGISEKQNRIDAYDDRWQRLRQVMAARAVEHAAVPGGATGLLVRQTKLVKIYRQAGGDDDVVPTRQSVLMDEYAVDTGLLGELRALEEQAARELGQWVENENVSGETRIVIEYQNDWRKANRAALPTRGTADRSGAG